MPGEHRGERQEETQADAPVAKTKVNSAEGSQGTAVEDWPIDLSDDSD